MRLGKTKANSKAHALRPNGHSLCTDRFMNLTRVDELAPTCGRCLQLLEQRDGLLGAIQEVVDE